MDLKAAGGVALVRALARTADVVVDPFRPGVLESLGLGPDALSRANPRLIYARMTGFRREGRYAAMAGHDINYLAVSGALSMLGRAGDKPHPPINILGDFAGGGAVLFQGVLLALVARERTGKGQVVEANMGKRSIIEPVKIFLNLLYFFISIFLILEVSRLRAPCI